MPNDLERFRTCAQAYGAQAQHWPAADRELHARFAATEEGTTILAAAARTDDFLDAWTPPPTDRALADRIALSVLDEQPRRRRMFVRMSATFAASAVFGFVVGFLQMTSDPAADLVTLLVVGPSVVLEIGP